MEKKEDWRPQKPIVGDGVYKSYLLFYNIQKMKNIGTLVRFKLVLHPITYYRSAAAFNVSKIFFITKKNKRKKIMKEFGLFGNKGTFKQMDYECFPSLYVAKEYFISHKISVVGVEIMNTAISITQSPFKGDSVFLPGNEVQLSSIHPNFLRDKV